MKPILVLGIGNILLGDEGVGVHTVWQMQRMALPPDVEAVDGGTSGADLIDVIADRRKLIVIDAVKADVPAGAVFRFGMDELIEQRRNSTISLHELGLLETLMMARQLDCLPKEIVIFGIVPKTIEPGLDLTPKIYDASRRVIGLVFQECGKKFDPVGLMK